MKGPKRWESLPIIFGVNIAIIFILAILDSIQIRSWFALNDPTAWAIYMSNTAPAMWKMWLLIFVIAGIVWYIATRDLSEGIGIALSGAIMVSTGLEDVFYFIISPQTMSSCMAYLNNIGFMSFASKYLLMEPCVSAQGLILNAVLGVGLAGLTLIMLARYRPYK